MEYMKRTARMLIQQADESRAAFDALDRPVPQRREIQALAEQKDFKALANQLTLEYQCFQSNVEVVRASKHLIKMLQQVRLRAWSTGLLTTSCKHSPVCGCAKAHIYVKITPCIRLYCLFSLGCAANQRLCAVVPVSVCMCACVCVCPCMQLQRDLSQAAMLHPEMFPAGLVKPRRTDDVERQHQFPPTTHRARPEDQSTATMQNNALIVKVFKRMPELRNDLMVSCIAWSHTLYHVRFPRMNRAQGTVFAAPMLVLHLA